MNVINSVNELLTADAMQTMNAAVDLDKREAGDVAQAFLEANQLV
jgi:glycine betaine/choline ABC-type transport system substrate-binding protein